MRNIILGSQSPRRQELLASLVGADRLQIVPPLSDEEAGFEGLNSIEAIENQLLKIVQQKQSDVRSQVETESCLTVCADTIVVVKSGEADWLVLGKPPEPNWQPVVRDWFRRFYSGRTHEVWTAFEIVSKETSVSRIVKTAVYMPPISDDMIEWYLSTAEPLGKAGGYGLQGHAAIFVEGVRGSLTNVIGLPMNEVATVLKQIESA